MKKKESKNKESKRRKQRKRNEKVPNEAEWKRESRADARGVRGARFARRSPRSLSLSRTRAAAPGPGPGPRRQAPPARAEALPAGPGWAGLGWAGPGRGPPRRGPSRGRPISAARGLGRFKRGGGGGAGAKFPPALRRASPAPPPRPPPRLPALGTGPGPGLSPPLRRLPVPHAAPSRPSAPGPGHVDAAVVRLHAGAGRLRVRGAAAGGEPGAPGPLPLVAAGVRPPAQERERPQGQSGGGLPPGQLPRALQDPGEPPVLAPQPPQAAAALAQGALRGSREAARAAAGRRGQIPGAPKVPPAPHHLGRRGDELLLQGEVAGGATGVVRAQPLPLAPREAGAGRGHRAHHHAGQQLVQEPAAAGPGGGGQGEGEHGEQQRGHQQTQPALPPGREQTPHVQLRGRIFTPAEPGSELGPPVAGEPRSRQELRVPAGLPARPPGHAQPPGPSAPGLAAGAAHLQPGGPGLLKGARGHGLSVVHSGR